MTFPRSYKRWLSAVAGFLFVLIVLKIAFVLTAKPKITVDYVAEYNKITRPANYDPNDNAAPYYQKAFDAFVKMPIELRELRVNWPADLNSAGQALLENWLASNSQSFEYFKIAANKPYYWLERYPSEDNNMLSILLPDLSLLKRLSEALLWNAKLAALKGQPQTVLEDIIDCYRVGCQKCRTPSSLTNQLGGMTLKGRAINSALLVLDKTQLDSSALKSFQTALQAEFDNDAYVPDFEAEKLPLYDAIQRTFIDNGRGTGRLAWSKTAGFAIIHYEWTDIKMQLNCFTGPTRNRTIEQIGKVFAISNKIMTKTPWQIKNQGYGYLEEVERISNGNFLLKIFYIGPESISNIYYKTRAQTEALITVLAILRFKTDNGRLPATLDELVSAGYLQSVPMDPYSDGPLVYKPDKHNFKLYSVGEDFVDDGGSDEAKKIQVSADSYHYQPPLDIVYWPVKKSKNPYYQPSAEELEKLRAAKEADVLGTTPDPNLPTFNK
jgi:hypothetical protein